MSDPIYAIGDVHGQLARLQDALAWIDADGGTAEPLVFVGDLVDRGPDSRGVIDLILNGQTERNWIVVKGNHDQLFQGFLETGAIENPRILSGKSWLHPRLGGSETLSSYGIAATDGDDPFELQTKAREAVPVSHVRFLKNLPRRYERGKLFFVHAGIMPGLPIKWQDEDDFLWIREPFLSDQRVHPWMIVHGHSPVEKPQRYINRINTDGGAGFGRPIYPVVIEGANSWRLGPDGREMM